MSWIVKWEQEDYDSCFVRLSREFTTKREAITHIGELRKAARDLGKHFVLLSLEAVRE